MLERLKKLETVKQGTWLKLIIGSGITLAVVSFIEFIMSRFNASTMNLMMKSMRGMFLSMFMRDVLNVAIQSVVLLLLIGAGVGMFLYFKRILKDNTVSNSALEANHEESVETERS
ncbi:hypothetical protein [Effusibacillus consociatus]|uniref:Uncharacterized protein n=1 Tax=Effusibacillus consociatus TaxID=1117041 RepID=A0ABV9PYV7_9BACL